MDPRIGHLILSTPPAAPRKDASAWARSKFTLASAHRAGNGGIPPEPPPDALREVDRAVARADELWHDNRELHFDMDEKCGRVVVQVRDLDGNVIRTIPPSEALDVMSGKPL